MIRVVATCRTAELPAGYAYPGVGNRACMWSTNNHGDTPMRPYNRAILEATNCTAEDAARIQVLMRWELDTLDDLDPQRFAKEARLACRELAVLRKEAAEEEQDGLLARRMLSQVELEARACV